MDTTVLPTEIVPNSMFGKRVILDILVKDEIGKIYNIEKQVFDLSITEQLRFQKYGFQIGSKQLRKGDRYTARHTPCAQLKVFYQIIFINDILSDSNLFVRHFKMTDEDGVEEKPYSIANTQGAGSRIYVHLPMIHNIANTVGFKNLSSFEKMCYLFVNNVDDVILKTEDRLVRALMEKYEEMQNNEVWWSWADAIERGEVAAEMRLREKTENARKEGLREGEIKGRIETLRMQIKTKYQVNDENWLLSLNASQLKKAIASILICNTYEQLKQTINTLV